MSRSVFAAIVGKPNVGKSTLINRMVGAKIAITSPKPQTTRNRIMGVLTQRDTQFVFLDTPGYHLPVNRLGEHMMRSVRESVSEIDAALFLTYPKSFFDGDERLLLDELFAGKTPVILVMNKSDILPNRQRGAEWYRALSEEYAFSGGGVVSARTGDGVDRLLETVADFGREGPFFYDEDTLTDLPEKVIVAELIREKLLLFLSDELPHGTAAAVDRFGEREGGGLIDIDVTILCEKQSHKGMIIGKGGRMLKKIATAARADIEDFLDARVNLQCWVKVREGWRNQEHILRDFGIL